MIRYYSLLILFSILSCKQNTKDKPKEVSFLVPESEVFHTVDSIFRINEYDHYDMSFGLVGSRMVFLDRFIKNTPLIDSFFTKEDIQFMKSQETASSTFTIKPEYFPYKVIIPLDTFISFMNNDGEISRKKLRERYGGTFYNTVSLPLFSIDRKTVIIAKSGMDHGGLYIYKKINSNWTIAKSYEWIE